MNRIIAWAFVALLAFPATGLLAQDRQLTLRDIWASREFFPDFPNSFRFMQDDRYYTTLDRDESAGAQIVRYHIEDENDKTVLLTLSEIDFGDALQGNEIQDYEFTPDESHIILKAEIESIYRRSSREVTWVYNRANKSLAVIHNGKRVSNATVSPDNKKVAYTFENNLYYHDLDLNARVQITFDGTYNNIINGSTDWVYEEELSFVRAFQWSPDGRYLAFYRFDESEVKEFNMAMYGSLYPEQYKFKYPKAGELNATVTIKIQDLKDAKTSTVDLKSSDTDFYISRMVWTPDGKLALQRLNRFQNRVDVILAEAQTGESRIILTETTDTYFEAEAYYHADGDRWYFLENSTDLIWASERSGWNHLYRYSRDGELKAQLTEGEFNVMDIEGINENDGKIYFISSEVSPLERHLYEVGLDGKKKKRLTKKNGTHNVTFSPAFTYYIDNYSDIKTPTQSVLCDRKGKEVKTLIDNKRLAENFNSLKLKHAEFIKIPTDDGVEMNACMLKPADFDQNKQYPVMMFCYGGPGSQEVLNAWGSGDHFNYMWHQMLTQKGYIVVIADNRGTGGRSLAYKNCTYKQMGKLETIDQVNAAKWLAGQSYVDGTRIGLWGWSYGGYLTSLCMVKGSGTFKMGIAVAPVTNWRYYDTIYTERYLQTPQVNPTGYDENSPINFAKDLQGKYLLIHGTADDNVHFQNSMEWVDALVRANKQFDSFFYPNRNHGIYGGITRYHLYTKMTDFVLENL
ncbi:MAG: S9 family peptidase [Bacteroidia bacterium]